MKIQQSLFHIRLYLKFSGIKPKISRWKSFEKSEISLDESDVDFAINDILEDIALGRKLIDGSRKGSSYY